jgi:hypothetical protein
LLAALLVNMAASQTSDKTDSIRGTVINRVTHAPISRALVISSDQRLATLTDGEGRFEFSLPRTADATGPDGNFNGSTFFFARKPGFLTENTSRGASSLGPGIDLPLGNLSVCGAEILPGLLY